MGCHPSNPEQRKEARTTAASSCLENEGDAAARGAAIGWRRLVQGVVVAVPPPFAGAWMRMVRVEVAVFPAPAVAT